MAFETTPLSSDAQVFNIDLGSDNLGRFGDLVEQYNAEQLQELRKSLPFPRRAELPSLEAMMLGGFTLGNVLKQNETSVKAHLRGNPDHVAQIWDNKSTPARVKEWMTEQGLLPEESPNNSDTRA